MAGNSTSPIKKYNTLVVAFRKNPLVSVRTVSLWQEAVKRSLDIIAAILGLILLFPLFVYIALRVKLDSGGSIFYFQERIGHNGVPFTIFKFRSMFEDAELDGPTLSCPNDTRVTRWGRVMRKWKLDELPQLLNVLIGDMSLVGPRPERQFYIDKVSAINPYFKYLHLVKPGLTSLGMVKFGYAQNVEQIIERMKYDINYIENYSLLLDLMVLCYTIPTIIDGSIFTTTATMSKRYQQAKLRPLS